MEFNKPRNDGQAVLSNTDGMVSASPSSSKVSTITDTSSPDEEAKPPIWSSSTITNSASALIDDRRNKSPNGFQPTYSKQLEEDIPTEQVCVCAKSKTWTRNQVPACHLEFRSLQLVQTKNSALPRLIALCMTHASFPIHVAYIRYHTNTMQRRIPITQIISIGSSPSTRAKSEFR